MLQEFGDVIDAIGPRLRELRRRNGTTLAALSEVTGIPVSTLSRLESGQRKPSLELLLPSPRPITFRSTNWSTHRRPATREYTPAR